MSRYASLWREARANPPTPHRVYRGIRAVTRLVEEGEVQLPEKTVDLAYSLLEKLEYDAESGTPQNSNHFAFLAAKKLLKELNSTSSFLENSR